MLLTTWKSDIASTILSCSFPNFLLFSAVSVTAELYTVVVGWSGGIVRWARRVDWGSQ